MEMGYLITFLFVVLDFTTGMVKSFATHSFTSSAMREGLVHKCGSLLCLMLGALAQFGMKYLDIGLTIPISTAICTYIVFMEIGSIIENLGMINPSIVPSELQKYFNKLNK